MTSWSPALMPRLPRSGRAMSLDEWEALPEDQSGELVAGRLTEEEMPDPIHEMTVTWLIALLVTWLKGRGGFVFGSEIKIKIDDAGGRKPDVSVVLPGRTPPRRRGLMTAPPDIAIEVISPSPRDERRDRVEKMTEYAQAGVRYYWLVDPGLGSFEIFELRDDNYARVAVGTEGALFPVPGCDGLRIDLDELWSELERLGPEEPS